MTDRELKQRCLELGYDEEKINRMIRETNVWAVLIRRRRGYFGRLFGDKYDDEVALRKLIDNWDEDVPWVAAINEDKIKHPEDYRAEKDGRGEIDLDDIPICINCGRGPWPGEEAKFRREAKKRRERQKRNHQMLKRKRKKKGKRN